MCIFCQLAQQEHHLFETPSFFGVWDIDPIQEGHVLVIAKQHRMNISELTGHELHEMVHLQKELTAIIESQNGVLGVTTIYNNGKAMTEGTHFHFHLIPRYEGDGFYDNQHTVKHAIDIEALTHQFNEI